MLDRCLSLHLRLLGTVLPGANQSPTSPQKLRQVLFQIFRCNYLSWVTDRHGTIVKFQRHNLTPFLLQGVRRAAVGGPRTGRSLGKLEAPPDFRPAVRVAG